jgi:two-component system LytT family response regulator
MTEPLGVLIVDDEAPARTNLRLALSIHARWRVVAEAADASEARAALGRGAVDLVFLDVQMPGEDGISFARWLAARPEPPIVIFATAYDRFAVEAFEAHALDYLL